MGYQFLHIEGYARVGSQQSKKGKLMPQKWSAQQIADEAERKADSCPHVPSPQPPKLLFGVTPSLAVQQAEKWAESAKDATGKRKLRVDGLCLAAGVISFPDENREQWPRFKEATLHWLKTQYGDRLRSVIEHTDESYPHLHFYVVPRDGERFEHVHAGRAAAQVEKEKRVAKGGQNQAYKEAMRKWQDDFYVKVARNFGLARLGPKRRRLSRGDWNAEKKQAQALANTRIAHEAVAFTVDEVQRQTVKKGLFKSEYESDETFADRMTELLQKKVGPVTSIAIKAKFHDEQATRLQAELEQSQLNLAETKKQFGQAQALLNLFTTAEIEQARREKNERLARQEAQRELEKKLQDQRERENQLQQEKLLQEQRAQERLSMLEKEKQSRIDAYPKLLRVVVGAAYTFVQQALEALKSKNQDEIDWFDVELKTIAESMKKNGQSARDVATAVCEFSPVRCEFWTHKEVFDFCDEVENEFLEEFELARSKDDFEHDY